jgi:hypothetical protein
MGSPQKRNNGFFQRLSSFGFLLAVYVVVICASSIFKYAINPEHGFNNYRIFKNAFGLLIHHEDLYTLHPDLYGDLYKYSPGFAVLMMPFYYLPTVVGLLLWNLLNGLLLFLAIKKLPLNDYQKKLALWIILPELLTSIQNNQSNALTAALILFTFISLRKGRPAEAAVSTVLAASIKIFGAMCGLFFLFFRRKGSYILWGILLLAVSQALPLLFISPAELKAQYLSWFRMMSEDHTDAVGLSLMHLVSALFSVQFNFTPVQIAGLLITLLPLVRISRYADTGFQLRYLASVLLALILFNHKAESPTFIIAVVGCAIWYCLSKKTTWEKVLLSLMLVLTCLSPTDLVPAFLKEEFFVKYSLKVLPCVIIWLVLQVEMFSVRRTDIVEISPY